MNDHTGRFVWYEWMGKNLPAARDFYRHVLGWEIVENDMAGFAYNIGNVAGYGVAGLFTTPPEAAGAPPCWTGYIWVPDVDAAAVKLKAAGGRVMREPFDIPNVGRMAVVSDPHGAPFALFRDAGGHPPAPPPPETPGLVGWRELHAGDGKAAFDFYATQFGWREDRQHDMGPVGIYRIFDSGDEQGGIMTKMPQSPGPCWLYYFNVEAADAANARVSGKGGKAFNGPHQVPGGQWVTQCTDPDGALFGLVAPRK